MKTRRNSIQLYVVILIGLCTSTSLAQTVRVEGGLIEGTIEDGIEIYKGIPFAAPPIGELRWRPPQPVKAWTGILMADKFAPACPQNGLKILGYTDYGMSEDCLYLNIWKPAGSTSDKLPVMVWIHGGGFAIGSTSQALTTGERLAKKGVIVVGVAYRLGALGFLAHKDLRAESEQHVSGNYGLMDQIAALKWIKNNISTFGGDTTNVTIFGESAGGQSVSMLAASPLTKGLFNRAICMSGGSFAPVKFEKETGFMQLLEGAENAGIEFMERMEVNSIEELRKTDVKKIVNDSASSLGGFWPVVDDYVITGDQYKLYEKGSYNDIPVMVGNTSDEGTLFVMKSDYEDYAEQTHKTYGPFAEQLLKFYPVGDKDAVKRSMADLFRDVFFVWETYTWANLQSKTGKSPVYVYYFDQPQPTSMLTRMLNSNGPYHGSDCAYVFHHLDQNPKLKYTDDDKQLSDLMITYWTNFAKFSDPNGESLPFWPVYEQGKPSVMILESNPHTEIFPNKEKIEYLDQYYHSKRAE